MIWYPGDPPPIRSGGDRVTNVSAQRKRLKRIVIKTAGPSVRVSLPIITTAQLRPVKILPNVEYRPLQRLIRLRTVFFKGNVVMGIEAFGVAVGGEGDGTMGFNRS